MALRATTVHENYKFYWHLPINADCFMVIIDSSSAKNE
jgi:hypothetical protein